MQSIQTGISLNNPNVKSINTNEIELFKLHEAPDEIYEQFINAQERFLEAQHTSLPDTTSDPRYQTYATVKVNGKVIANIDNNGFVESSNAIGSKIHKALLQNDFPGQKGPELAQSRADLIADLLNGKVEKSSTSLTQHQFNTMPNINAQVDYQSMQSDPLYEQLLKTKESRTLFLAQQMA
ncbi:MAG: hypothetical protein ACRBCK_11115 [Alphaproteobacteria bacterium]